MKNIKSFKFIFTFSLILSLFFSLIISNNSYAAFEISLSQSNLVLDYGGTSVIKAKNTKEKVKWSSSNTIVATVTSTGKLKANIQAQNKGTAIITAKIGKKKYTCKVKVLGPMKISRSNFKMYTGNTSNVNIQNAKEKVNWASSDNTVATVTSTDNKNATIEAKNEGTTIITAFVDGQEFTCKVEVLGPQISQITDRQVNYYTESNSHKVFFSLLNSSKQRVAANMNVDIKIINDNGEKVYEKTHQVTKNNYSEWTSHLVGTRYMASINIPRSEIVKGSSESGKIHVTVTGKTAKFDEYSLSINKLPYVSSAEKSSLNLPTIPTILNNYSWRGIIDAKVMITNIQYSFEESYDNKVKLTINFEGERIAAGVNDGKNEYTKISYKLYKDGFVIKSGTTYTPSLNVGEKFKDEKEYFYSLEPGEYTLELLNTN